MIWTAIRREPARIADKWLNSGGADCYHGHEGFAGGPAQGGWQFGDVFDGVICAKEAGDHDEDSGWEEDAEEELLGDWDPGRYN